MSVLQRVSALLDSLEALWPEAAERASVEALADVVAMRQPLLNQLQDLDLSQLAPAQVPAVRARLEALQRRELLLTERVQQHVTGLAEQAQQSLRSRQAVRGYQQGMNQAAAVAVARE